MPRRWCKSAIAGDGRHALVQLTASGQALYEELFPKVQFINQLLGDISEAQLQTLSQVFAKIGQRARGHAAAGRLSQG
ncbi:hypothetical protein J4714_14700 [Staphylococcus epidermidis]|nr:hypothetical protein [Staphylococcus epidermidis]